jgi:SAM-dependent methyltransferase
MDVGARGASPNGRFCTGVRAVPQLFAFTLFVSALLLFMVQPMVGKLLLPYLGGSAAVWNTCMVFFQAVLLGGYIYAHTTSARLGVRRQIGVHYGVLLAPIVAMLLSAVAFGSPVAVVRALTPQGDTVPILGVLLVLTVAIGVPFFVVSTSAPLLQKWFTATGHPSARDPYFLYAASNIGSFLSLLAYPFVIEPVLTLKMQTWVWLIGYVALAGLIAYCGRQVLATPETLPKKVARAQAAAAVAAPTTPVTWPQRLHWLALAAVPSSLMLGVTTYMTTDIASIPMLWIIPLAIYLLTFVIAFARIPEWVHTLMVMIAPVLMLLLLFLFISGVKPRFNVLLGLHIATFTAVALVMHGELARTRPAAENLTEFYLIMSAGGVIGGLFNALLAPLIFTGVTEYVLAVVVGCLLVPPTEQVEHNRRTRIWDGFFPLLIGVLAYVLHYLLYGWNGQAESNDIQKAYIEGLRSVVRSINHIFVKEGGDPIVYLRNISTVVTYGIPAMLCYIFIARPIRFGLCVAALVVASWLYEDNSRTLYQGRSFFGVLRVDTDGSFKELEYGKLVDPDDDKSGRRGRIDHDGTFHKLVHGTTLHGKQRRWPTDPVAGVNALRAGILLQSLATSTPFEAAAAASAQWELLDYPSHVPLTYYHRSGPIGRVLSPLGERVQDAAFIGLGTGTLAAYARPGMNVTFYEIDQHVIELASNPKYFTFLEKCHVKPTFKVGDARVMLEAAPANSLDFIAVDAFSSDSIPIHLLTKEALQLYFDKLRPDGVVCLHISNRYLNLERVVGALVRDLKYAARVWDDTDDEVYGKTASTWVVLAKNNNTLQFIMDATQKPVLEHSSNGSYKYNGDGTIATTSVWRPLRAKPSAQVWTDDYSNVIDPFLYRDSDEDK